MSIDRSHIVGVLLAGGRSSRMFTPANGPSASGDKGLLDLGGKPMLQHVIDRLAPQVGQLVINANRDTGRFAAFGLPVIADTIDGYPGPLAGVLAAMRWVETNAPEARFIVTVSTDAPFLATDLVARLLAGEGEEPGSIAFAASGGEAHPVIALWPVTLADKLETSLSNGERKVIGWMLRQGAVPVEFPFVRIGDTCVDPFFNANTPEELAEARRFLAGES